MEDLIVLLEQKSVGLKSKFEECSERTGVSYLNLVNTFLTLEKAFETGSVTNDNAANILLDLVFPYPLELGDGSQQYLIISEKAALKRYIVSEVLCKSTFCQYLLNTGNTIHDLKVSFSRQSQLQPLFIENFFGRSITSRASLGGNDEIEGIIEAVINLKSTVERAEFVLRLAETINNLRILHKLLIREVYNSVGDTGDIDIAYRLFYLSIPVKALDLQGNLFNFSDSVTGNTILGISGEDELVLQDKIKRLVSNFFISVKDKKRHTFGYNIPLTLWAVFYHKGTF